MSRYQSLALDTQYLLFDSERLPDCHPHHFDAEYWKQQGAIVGSSFGRGTTWFLRHQQYEYVLRHYHRGGLVGRFNRDQFLYTGRRNTRVVREFQLLQQMFEQGLPVPRPIAGRIIRTGHFYTADLIIERIAGASDLVHLLEQGSLPRDTWVRIGELVARFHNAGIWHADLNAHNILRDAQGKLWLIDFDRGHQRSLDTRWPQANLDRLLRSFNKELGRLPVFQWEQARDWPPLLEGYQAQRNRA